VTASGTGWPVVYYRDADGTEPVNDFIDALEPKVQVVLDNQIERIAHFGPQLPFPHSSQVEGELRELRCHYGSTLYRVLYRRSDNLFVLLHILEKRSGAISEGDKQIARERWADFKQRMNERPRRPPRAAGHDAP
jgi:phage-related protein